jgi:hypothetical protein
MKKIILLVLAHAFAYPLWAQGSLQLTAGANIRSSGGGYLVLDNMNILNNGSLKQAAGNGVVKSTGDLGVSLSGNGTTVIDELVLAKTGTAALTLQSNISVVSKVNFSGGLLNLNNSILDLDGTGIFTGESELSRAFSNGNGYIQATGILNSPASINIANLGAVISSPANMGATVIRRGHAVQTVSGNSSIRRYFDIVPTNNSNLKATLRLYYFDAELRGVPENTLNQWKSQNNSTWDLVGADSRDVSADYVEKTAIASFSRWTLATASAPAITCPANMTVTGNMSGCKASVSFSATAKGTPTPTITYSIGNKTITSPFVFSKGTTTVTATASNGVLPNATCAFTVTVVCGTAVTKAAENPADVPTSQLTISARPNPSEHYFALDVKSGDFHPVSIKIIDVLGRLVAAWSNVASNSTLYMGHNYLPGIYYVKAIQGKQVVTLKLVKQAF